MTFLTRHWTRSRVPGAALGVVLALTVPAAGVSGAEAPTDSLCETISVEQLNALGPLQYAAPEPVIAGMCVFEESSGSASLALVISGVSFDLMRTSSPEAVEAMVGDRPAVAIDGSLHVGLDEGILSVILEFTSADAVGDLDPIAYAIDVAEIVVPALATMSGTDDPASPGTLVPPPEVEGITWGRSQVVNGEELMESDEQQQGIWQPLLDAVGLDAAQLFTMDVTAIDAQTEERLGTYSAIQLVGTETDRLRSAIVDWVRSSSGDAGLTTNDVALGGKDVVLLTFSAGNTGYLYVAGDTAHALTIPEAAAATVLEALP